MPSDPPPAMKIDRPGTRADFINSEIWVSKFFSDFKLGILLKATQILIEMAFPQRWFEQQGMVHRGGNEFSLSSR